jgi:2-polyprenyl-6-methoxyphenol hydroxylase-like FAD-dependent oxidoreductase
MILLAAVKDRIGAENVVTGHHLVSFAQDGSGVTANFIHRGTGQPLTPQRSELLIGCDGIRSAVRAQLYPNEGMPVASGRVHCRGVVEAQPFLDGRTHVTMGFSDQRAVIYPIRKKSADNGHSRINWVVSGRGFVASRNAIWDHRVPNEQVIERFKDWKFGWIDFADLISRTDEIYEYPEVDRDPVPRWSFGLVTLLGDAAHPMRPTGAQAGSQAIVDARVLAFALAQASTREQGLYNYEAMRRPHMSAVTLRNRECGPLIVMELAEQRAPQGFAQIEDVITASELEEISAAYKLEAGFEPQALNERPTLTVHRKFDEQVARFGTL